MTKISLQFHADREELFSWLSSWAEKAGMQLAGEQFFPDYEVRLVDDVSALREWSGLRRISLAEEVVLGCGSSAEYLRKNVDVLTVLLGRQDDGVLGEAFLA